MNTSLEGLLRQTLERELADSAIAFAPEACAAARAEFERALGPHAHAGLSIVELEQCVQQALTAARVVGGGGPEAGATLDGKYRLEELLGEGGFGRVYRALDLTLDCPVAIKLLKPSARPSPANESALLEEARRMTRLRHANIVEWKTLNRAASGQLYLVMEHLEGESLAALLERERKIEPTRAARLLLALLDAVAHAHELADGDALLHLDLKPSNVFLARTRPGEERVKVLDFGISRFASEAVAPATIDEPCVPGATALVSTHAGALALTPAYCSPEQAARALGDPAAGALDGRSDLFSLGVIAYRMLVGAMPWSESGSLFATLKTRCEVDALPLAGDARVPRRLARFVERCLARDPGARFASVRAAHAELARILAPRTHGWVALVATLVAFGLVVRAWLVRPEPVAGSLRVFLTQNGRSPTGLLWFGPARRSLRLMLPELSEDVRGVRLVSATRADAAEVPGWRALAGDAGELELLAEGEAARSLTAYLRLDTREGVRLSEPLQLAYAPAGSSQILSADVPGREGRALSPRGQRLDVRVRGAAELLPDSLVLVEGGRSLAVPRTEVTTEDESHYGFELEALKGPGKIQLRLVDLAGNESELALDLPLVRERIGLTEASLAGATRLGDTWQVLSGERPTLSVTTDRPAALTWSLLEAGGRELAAGSSAAAATHAVELDSGAWPAREFAGLLRLRLDERGIVQHAEGGGVLEHELALEVRASGAAFDVTLSGARAWLEPGALEAVQYTGAGELRLALLRAHELPMVVELAADVADVTLTPRRARFATAAEERKTISLDCARDGRHVLEFVGRRSGLDGSPLDLIDQRRTLVIVRDTSVPRLTLGVTAGGEPLRSRAELALREFELHAEDAVFSQDPPPLTVAWRISTVAGERVVEFARGELALAVGTTTRLTLANLAATFADGDYELELVPRDFVGNQGEARRTAFSVSTEGPRLDLVAPAQGEVWVRASERFTVELLAEDPNGVGAIECRLVDQAGELEAHGIELVRNPAESALTRWSGSFELDQRWAGRTVRLSVRGTDGRGTVTLEALEITCRVGPIPSTVPARVEFARAGRPAARLVRVRGNAGAAYVFGGRGDVIEGAALRALGLAGFAGGALPSSLALVLPPGAISDFYLAENEVDVGSFLAFVRASASRDHGLAHERRVELETRLSALDPNLPVTDVTLFEAQAFADWCGLELPSWLHWEYAVRGLASRPFSFVEGFDAALLGTSLNVGTGVPWPIARGVDRTPEGLVNLCSNVSEWSSTPVDEGLQAGSGLELLVGVRAAAGTRHFVVGGACDRTSFHFATIARRAADYRAPTLGFRCMLPAARVDAAFLEPSGDLRVEALR